MDMYPLVFTCIRVQVARPGCIRLHVSWCNAALGDQLNYYETRTSHSVLRGNK